MISYSVRPWVATQNGIQFDSSCPRFVLFMLWDGVFRLIFVAGYANLSRLVTTGYLLMAVSGSPGITLECLTLSALES